VIGCIRAGFELVGRNLWLLGFPVSLDLFLWLGPRLSVGPLLRALLSFFDMQRASDPSLAPQVALLRELIEQVGQRFNLVSLVSALPLFTVPSLLSGRPLQPVSPLGGPLVQPLTNPFLSLVLSAGILGIGLLLGTAFLYLLASRVVASRPTPKPRLRPVEATAQLPELDDGKRFARPVRAFLFVSGVVAVCVCLLPLWAVVIGLAAMIAPLVGLVLWLVSVGIVSYLCLHLLFVVHGVLLSGRGLIRAVWESVVLIHVQLPSVAGLIVLVVVIHQGLGRIWSLPSGDSWLLLVGILGNACIATGLTAATFVFYEERIPRAVEAIRRRRQPRNA
jgi:hypothetical protein